MDIKKMYEKEVRKIVKFCILLILFGVVFVLLCHEVNAHEITRASKVTTISKIECEEFDYDLWYFIADLDKDLEEEDKKKDVELCEKGFEWFCLKE